MTITLFSKVILPTTWETADVYSCNQREISQLSCGRMLTSHFPVTMVPHALWSAHTFAQMVMYIGRLKCTMYTDWNNSNRNKVYQLQKIFCQPALIALCKICFGRKQTSPPYFLPKPYTRQWTHNGKKWVEANILCFCLNCPILYLPYLRTYNLHQNMFLWVQDGDTGSCEEKKCSC